MKKLFLLLAFFACASVSAHSQSIPPTKWVEADGSPSANPPTKVIVPNGSISGKTVTLTGGGGGSGTVTSVAFTGGLISVANPTTAAALTVAGTSGGIPYFSSASTWASSAALTANLPVIGGGAGAAPSVGTRSGNTTAFVTTTGTQTSGRCVTIDASGNHIADAAGCGASAALSSTQVGYGSGANVLTGSTDLTYVTGSKTLTITSAATSFLDLAGVSTASAVRVSAGAHPGAGGGVIFPFTGGDQTSGPGVWWCNNAYNACSRFNLNLGFTFQGGGTSTSPVKILKGTGTSADGALVFELRPDDGAFNTYPFGTSAGNTTEHRFLELAANGTNYTSIRAADTITTNSTIVLPINPAPSVNDVLTVTAVSSGVVTTAWQAASGGGLTINTTTITGGTTTRLLYDNAGTVGEISGLTSNGSTTLVQTSASATAFESGPNGSTNPVFRIVNSTASQADGISVTGLAAGSGTTFTALSSGSNAGITFLAKGTGTIVAKGGTSSGNPFQVQDESGNAIVSVARSGYVTTFGSGGTLIGEIGSSGGVPYFQFNGTGDLRRASFAAFTITNPTLRWPNSTPTIGIDDDITGGIRVNNGSTGAGNLAIGTSAAAIGTSGAGVLAFTLSTAPSTSPTDTVQLYSNDAAAADHNLFSRNEAGEVNRLTGLAARNSAQFDKTNATLATVTGLTRNVEAGRTYAFRAVLQTTAVATGGVKFAVSGTATATAISYEGTMASGAVIATQTRATALDTTVCASTTTTAGTCYIEGVIQVNAAGTFLLQFAQNNTDASASSVLANSYFQLIPIS